MGYIEKVPEKVLQDWFVKEAEKGELQCHIRNRADLNSRLKELRSHRRATQQIEYWGLKRAIEACGLFAEASLLVANKNVANDNYNQVRPDIILFTSSADYILVELKTREKAERQGVQELLACSAAIKMQAPYINDFVYVVVAVQWTSLLELSVRSLILDDKNVLPLKCTMEDHGGFSLEVMSEFFKFDLVRNYDPMVAMRSATMGVRISQSPLMQSDVNRYFRNIAWTVYRRCIGLRQSGFVIMWVTPYFEGKIISLTLFTVDQHCVKRESTYMSPSRTSGFSRVLQKKSEAAYEGEIIEDGDELDFLFSAGKAAEAADELFPQSSQSYTLLERERDRLAEKKIRNLDDTFLHFEIGGSLNMLDFMRQEIFERSSISLFLAFGELADYREDVGFSWPREAFDLISILRGFQNYKSTTG